MFLKNIPKTFIGFLGASFLIWLLITFSKEYKTSIVYNLDYKDMPQNKLLQEKGKKEITLTINASGFKILRSKIRSNKLVLDASNLQVTKKSEYYLLLKNQRVKIQNQLLSGVEMIEMNKDTVFLDVGELASKRVALKQNVKLNFHKGYDLLESISTKPDSVVISGTKSEIEKISFLNLENLELTDVKSNFEKTLTILVPENIPNLKLNRSKTIVSGKVDKFTEGKIKAPFKVNNLPKNIDLTTLSDKVEITFIVALSNFSKVSEASFKVECDYKVSEINNLGYLIPKLTLMPDFVKSYKIIPNKIDFLIQK